jgi:hypothetical protein
LYTQVTGEKKVMQIRKVIQRRIRRSGQGVDFAGDLNAAISANVGERSKATHVSSRTEKEGRRDEAARRTSS